jgi:hypothetical protein
MVQGTYNFGRRTNERKQLKNSFNGFRNTKKNKKRMPKEQLIAHPNSIVDDFIYKEVPESAYTNVHQLSNINGLFFPNGTITKNGKIQVINRSILEITKNSNMPKPSKFSVKRLTDYISCKNEYNPTSKKFGSENCCSSSNKCRNCKEPEVNLTCKTCNKKVHSECVYG